MKNIKVLLGLALAGALVFSGCSKDDEAAVAPSLGVTASETSINKNGEIYLAIDAREGDANLKSITIKVNGGAATDIDNVEWTDLEISNPYVDTAYFGGGIFANEQDYVFEVTVTDKDDLKTTKSVTINVTSGIVSYTASLGAQGATKGSGFSTLDGIVYSLSADTNFTKSDVDITFAVLPGTGTYTTNTILSVPQRKIDNVGTLTGGVATYFASSSINFDAATAAELNAITASSNQKVTVTAGSTYEFVSGLGTKGIFKVISVGSPSNTTEIEISVKLVE